MADAEERLYEDLEWAGIEWDEGPNKGGGCGPYKQSQRTAIYQDHAERLLSSGDAYRCFCSSERLHTLAAHRQSLGQPLDYDRACAHIPREESDDRAAKGEAHVVRLKAPEQYPAYEDLVYGLIRQKQDIRTRVKGPLYPYSYEDPVLLKSDGFPTYHLASVVDDHLMEITHVIRGSEWMSSTPKHLTIYKAFGWEPPAYAHVGLLLDKSGAKLSKRNASIDIAEWREKGVFPETLTNFVTLLGWSHRQKMDLMSMKELIQFASMKFTRGDTTVDFGKLWFLQRRHAERYTAFQDPSSSTNIPPNRDLNIIAVQPVVKALAQRSEADLPVYSALPTELSRQSYVRSIVWADAKNYTTPSEFIDWSIYFFTRPSPADLEPNVPDFKLQKIPSHVPDTVVTATFLPHLGLIVEIPSKDWTVQRLKGACGTLIAHAMEGSTGELELSAEEENMMKKAWSRLVYGYLRWALMVGKPGADTTSIMEILGKKETVWRLGVAKEIVEKAFRDEESSELGGVTEAGDGLSK